MSQEQINRISSSENNRIVIFSHILKTGGLTLSHIMSRQYKPHFFTVNQAPFEVQKEIRRLQDAVTKPGISIQGISGHIGFGVDKLLPFPCTYITLLRDPVERVISNYYHRRRQGLDIALEEFLTKEARFSFNLQTRFLSGFEFDQQISGGWNQDSFFDIDYEYLKSNFTSSYLQNAKNNLCNSFCCIGLTQWFDESLLLFRHALKWKCHNTFYVRTNVGTNKPRIESFSEETLSCIREFNQFDIELYNYAKQLFDVQIESLIANLDRDKVVFKILNSAFSSVYPALQSTQLLKLLKSVR